MALQRVSPHRATGKELLTCLKRLEDADRRSITKLLEMDCYIFIIWLHALQVERETTGQPEYIPNVLPGSGCFHDSDLAEQLLCNN